ncbi:MAG: hypothetical protein ACXABO_17350 [Promethearchaeota archaeon]|jgi:hypothetical protein
MTETSKKFRLTSFTFLKRITEDCLVLWDQGIVPSIDQLLYEYEILDIDGRWLDPVSYHKFWGAIDYLSAYGFISIYQDSYMIKRIAKGRRNIPENLLHKHLRSIKD